MTTGVFAAFDDDDFAWWIGRLAAAGRAEAVHRTLAHADRRGVNAWFAARDARNEVAGYASDLAVAWDLADAEAPSAEAVALQFRYALIRALLRDLGSRFRPGLAAALVRSGEWTREQALAWGELSQDTESSIELTLDALAAADGTRRELLLTRAIRSAANFVTEAGPLHLAEVAKSAAPHEQALLLEAILSAPDRGGLVHGLRALAPHLPTALRQRLHDAATDLPDWKRLQVLSSLAQSGTGAAAEAYAEVLSVARATLSDHEVPCAERVRMLQQLAADLPRGPVDDLVGLLDNSGLTGYDRLTIVAAMLAREARYEPDDAVEAAMDVLPERSHLRDDVLVAAAASYASLGRYRDAAMALGDVRHEPARADALTGLAMSVPDPQDPDLLLEVDRLSPSSRPQVLRAIADRVERPAPALLALADATADEGARLRARCALAVVLSPEEVGGTLDRLLAERRLDTSALADLARVLTVEQARSGLDAVLRSGSPSASDLAGLCTRLVDLGDTDGALARVGSAADPAQLWRPEVLDELAGRVAAHSLPAIRSAVQPRSAAVERIAALVTLSDHLPADLVGEVVDEAMALPHPADRSRALARLAAAGHDIAVGALPDAVRETCASLHVDRFRLALEAVTLSAASPSPLPLELVDAVAALPSERRSLACLALALSPAGGPSATAAASRLVELLTRGGGMPHEASVVADAVLGSEKKDSGALCRAVLAVADDGHFAYAVSVTAPVVRGACERTLERARGVGDDRSRLLALTALAKANPAQAPSIAMDEWSRSGSWLDDPHCLVMALGLLDAGGLALDEALVRQAWKGACRLVDPAALVACGTSLSGLSVPPQAEVAAIAAGAMLQLEGRWRWVGVTGLAAVLPRDELEAVARLLPDAARDDVNVRFASSACAVRAADLGDDSLAVDLLCAAPEVFTGTSPAALAAPRLTSSALRLLVERLDDRRSLAEVAVAAAEHDDQELATLALARVTYKTDRTDALLRLARTAPATWTPWLVRLADNVSEGPRADVLAARALRASGPEQLKLAESALQASHGYRMAQAPLRARLLTSLLPVLSRLPRERLSALWAATMRTAAELGRDEVFVDVEALAPALIDVFGPGTASALFDAVRLGGTDTWPCLARPVR